MEEHNSPVCVGMSCLYAVLIKEIWANDCCVNVHMFTLGLSFHVLNVLLEAYQPEMTVMLIDVSRDVKFCLICVGNATQTLPCFKISMPVSVENCDISCLSHVLSFCTTCNFYDDSH
jgi:hypothetical protein